MHPISCRVVNVVKETTACVTLTLAYSSEFIVPTSPGQCISLKLDPKSHMDGRIYTLSDFCEETKTVDVTVKVVEGGTLSHWLVYECEVGQRIYISQPFGCFLSSGMSNKEVIAYCAGSGITPFLSAVRFFIKHPQQAPSQFHLVYSATRIADCIGFHYLYALSSMHSWLTVRFHVSHCTVQERQEFSLKSRMTDEDLKNYNHLAQWDRFFVCGPTHFMDFIHCGHSSAIPIESESFHLASVVSEQFEEHNESINIEIEGQQIVNGSKSVKLLHSLGNNGVIISKSCGLGLCQMCKVKITKGVVRYDGGTLSNQELDSGFRLACCSWPESDISLSVPNW